MKNIFYKNFKLSQLCLGTVQFGLDYGIANQIGQPNQENINRIIDYLNKNGLNIYDTAFNYGESQSVIGKSFKQLDINPFIVSKILSDEFKESYEVKVSQSLQELNVGSLFALLLHDTKLLDSWDAEFSFKIKSLKEQGLVSFFGVSIYDEKDFEKALLNEDIQVIQIPFNLFDQRAIHQKWIQKAKEKGKLLFIRSIFLQGLLLMTLEKIPAHLEKSKKFIKMLEDCSLKFNLTRHEIVVSFVKSIAKESVLLFGCETLEQARENVESFNSVRQLTKAEIDYVLKIFHDVEEDIYLPTRW